MNSLCQTLGQHLIAFYSLKPERYVVALQSFAMNVKIQIHSKKKRTNFTRINSLKHRRISFLRICRISIMVNCVGGSLCSYESVIKKDLMLMNWVGYSGHIMVVQGYVSLQKSIGTWHWHWHSHEIWLSTPGSGWGGYYSKTAPLHLTCFFSFLQIKWLHLFTLWNIPFQRISWNIFDTFSWHCLWCLVP